ncbi:MAG: flagellar basal body P-ring formation protein FlgA [Planctomycetes bacterium]|nr:flagellar basal body P-ring formation protein FlgA [Planctomycetota bacterium]
MTKTIPLIILLAAALAQGQEAAVMVEIRAPRLELAGNAVRLQDVAQVTILAAEGRDLRVLEYRANGAELHAFKAGEMAIELGHEDIKMRLKRLGLTDVSVAGPKKFSVARKSKRLDNRRVLDLARSHVRNALAGIDDDAQVEFARLIEPVCVPAGRYSMDVRFEADPNNREYVGNADLRLVAEVDGVVEHLATIPVRVTRRVNLVRIARAVRAGSVLGRDDLVLEERRAAQSAGNVYFRLEDVIGQIATRDLKEGLEVCRADLRARPIVRKDDFVNVRVVKGALKVVALCQALHDGAPGDLMTFRNLSTEKEIQAVLVDRQNAEIDLNR